MAHLNTPALNDTPTGETEARTGICAWTSLNCKEGGLLSGIMPSSTSTARLMRSRMAPR